MNRSAIDIIQSGLSNIVNKYFINDAKHWDAMYRHRYERVMDSYDQRPRHDVIRSILAEKFVRPGELLDVGCGVGTSFALLHPLLSRYQGIDLSAEAIAICCSKFAKNSNYDFEIGDFLQKNFPNQFDVVLFNESLYYFPLQKIEAVVSQARAVVRRDGSLVVSMSKNPKSAFIWSKLDSLLGKIHDVSIGTAKRPARWRVRSFRLW